MSERFHVPKSIIKKLEEQGVSIELTTKILNKYNTGEYDTFRPIRVKAIPEVDGERIIDLRGDFHWGFDETRALRNLSSFNLFRQAENFGTEQGSKRIYSKQELHTIGEMLLPYVSFGILNGGSATSYMDMKKNSAYQQALYESVKPLFGRLAKELKNKSKGITPAFIQKDGSPGPGFIELKMRSLLIQSLYYRKNYGKCELQPLFPMFQMTSVKNNDEISGMYNEYKRSVYLKPLIDATGIDITEVVTGVQPLIVAFSHSEEGKPKYIFSKAFGRENETLPLPGGHGQSFVMLKEVYRKLHQMGKRFVQLTNVDNLGSTVDPVEVAILAISGNSAGFDFSFKTPVDIKGGILVKDEHYGFTTGDIGPAISAEEVSAQESAGKKILFNCGTGLFNLSYLVENLDSIADHLPVRFSDQHKDAGRYSQAEQVTWEVQGILDDFLGFAVDKYNRFLASKLLLENFLTSGIGTDRIEDQSFRYVAEKLQHGLENKLEGEYGMKFSDGRWVPKTPDELFH